MNHTCVHSCKGLCSALEVAEHRERETIKEYRGYSESCDYPDVRGVLEELIKERERGLKRLQEIREILVVKFGIVDNINESFS
jgi:rubrerythrin